MARAGDILENPATGERLTFLRTGAETNGQLLEYDLEFTPRGFTARDHLHPHQEERHEVLDGQLGMVVAGRERRLGVGDVEVVPPAAPHRLFPLGDGRLRARFALRPARETEALLETLFNFAPGDLNTNFLTTPDEVAVKYIGFYKNLSIGIIGLKLIFSNLFIQDGFSQW